MSYTPTLERPHPAGMGGVQKMYEFPNGYSASVVRFHYSYGGDRGLWELAVLHNGKIVYDTPITDDVMGHLSLEEVERVLADIEALPARQEVA